jgi:hypothetical protein
MSELAHALIEAERTADLIEAGRLEAAYQRFFDSDWRKVIHDSLNSQSPMHASNPDYANLTDLIQSLTRLSPNPIGPPDPETIRSCCRDIRERATGTGAPDPEDKAIPAEFRSRQMSLREAGMIYRKGVGQPKIKRPKAGEYMLTVIKDMEDDKEDGASHVWVRGKNKHTFDIRIFAETSWEEIRLSRL